MECGAKLEYVCPECGTELPQGAKFCMECGTKLDVGATYASPEQAVDEAIPKLEDMHAQLESLIPDALAQKYLTAEQQAAGENRLITALFADISGFTAITEGMDAEDVQETINALWSQVDKAITDHNGRIDKHIGDAVMALWGTGAAREDDAEQAIRASLALHKAVQSYVRKGSAPLEMRIGINTGPVLLGEVGSTAEYTAMGNTVNTASRLCAADKAGQIIISENSRNCVEDAFELAEIEAVRAKGKFNPVRAFTVVRELSPRAAITAGRGYVKAARAVKRACRSGAGIDCADALSSRGDAFLELSDADANVLFSCP